MEDKKTIQNFAPYCVRKCTTKKDLDKYDLVGGPGVFLVANAILKIQAECGENYMRKDSWFQVMCEKIMKERPILSPNEADELSQHEIGEKIQC